MKKLALLLCLLLAGQWAEAQTFDDIFAECKEVKGAMPLNLSKDMLQIGLAMRKNDSDQLAVLKKVTNMKMVIVPTPDSLLQKKVSADMAALERPDGYTKIVAPELKAESTQQLFLIRAEGEETDNPIITELAAMVIATDKGGQQFLLLAQILGAFDVDDLIALSRIASHR